MWKEHTSGEKSLHPYTYNAHLICLSLPHRWFLEIDGEYNVLILFTRVLASVNVCFPQMLLLVLVPATLSSCQWRSPQGPVQVCQRASIKEAKRLVLLLMLLLFLLLLYLLLLLLLLLLLQVCEGSVTKETKRLLQVPYVSDCLLSNHPFSTKVGKVLITTWTRLAMPVLTDLVLKN